VRGDATAGLPFADGEFDLVYCSSVIEHVPPPAGDLRRGGSPARARVVRADPAWSFPLEPHSLLPCPLAARAAAEAYWRVGAAGAWEDIELLRRRELEACSDRLVQAIGPLIKSWVCVRPRPSGVLAAERLMSLLTR